METTWIEIESSPFVNPKATRLDTFTRDFVIVRQAHVLHDSIRFLARDEERTVERSFDLVVRRMLSRTLSARDSCGGKANRQGKDLVTCRVLTSGTRRRFTILFFTAFTRTCTVGQAKAEDGSTDVPPPFVQELIRRTEEKREERYRERLRHYYRKNYKDYFAFEAGKVGYGNTDLERKVLRWLQENKE